MCVRRVRLVDLVVEPHVRDSHAVLRESPGLVGADDGGGAEGLDTLEVLHQAVLLRHALGRQRQDDLPRR